MLLIKARGRTGRFASGQGGRQLNYPTIISTAVAPLLAALIALPLGAELARAWQGAPTLIGRFSRALLGSGSGVQADPTPRVSHRRSALGYSFALLAYNAAGYIVLYAWLRVSNLSHPAGGLADAGQAHAAAVALAALTATDDSDILDRLVSIAVSGGTALTLSAALARAVVARRSGFIGDFWADLLRSGLHALAPLIALTAALLTIGPRLAPPTIWPFVSAQIGVLAFAIPPFAGVFAFGFVTRACAEGRTLAIALAAGLAASAQVLAFDPAPPGPGAEPSWPSVLLDAMLRGGLGTGLVGALTFALLVACALGLLAGRSPEYLGKRLEPADMQLVILAAVGPWLAILGLCVGAARAPARPPSAQDVQVVMSLARVVGRFGVAIPILALAGRLSTKPRRAETSGVAPTDGLMFTALVTATILLMAALVYLPAIGLQKDASRVRARPFTQIRGDIRNAQAPGIGFGRPRPDGLDVLHASLRFHQPPPRA